MKVLIGTSSPIGHYLSSQEKFDYLIDSGNLELIRNKQFREIVCTIADIAEEGPLPEEKDALRFEKLTELLMDVKTERFTLISRLDLLQPEKNGVRTEHSPRHTPDTAPSPYLNHRARFEEFVQLRFGRVLILRLPSLVFHEKNLPGILSQMDSVDAIAQYPANQPHHLFYLPRLKNDRLQAWQLGLSSINLSPEAPTTMDIVREFAPEHISALQTVLEYGDIPALPQSGHSIHWFTPDGHISSRSLVLKQIGAALGK